MESEQGVLVEEQDLHLYRIPIVRQVLDGILLTLAGLFGTIYLSLGLGFIDGNLALGVALVMALYGGVQRYSSQEILSRSKLQNGLLVCEDSQVRSGCGTHLPLPD